MSVCGKSSHWDEPEGECPLCQEESAMNEPLTNGRYMDKLEVEAAILFLKRHLYSPDFPQLNNLHFTDKTLRDQLEAQSVCYQDNLKKYGTDHARNNLEPGDWILYVDGFNKKLAIVEDVKPQIVFIKNST